MNNNILSKIYLYIYSISFFIIAFASDSEIVGENRNEEGFISYTAGLRYPSYLASTIFLVIFLNYLLLFYSNIKYLHIKHLLIGISLLIIFFIKPLSNYQIIDSHILMIYLFILNSNLVNPYKFIKVDFFTRLMSMLFIIGCYFANVFPGVNSINLTRGGTLRYTFGYIHPNGLALSAFGILIAFVLYSHIYNINYIYYFLIFGLVGFMSVQSQSREVQISSIIIILLLIIKKILNILNINFNWIKTLVLPSMILSFLTSIYFIFFIRKSSFYWYINSLLSRRPLDIFNAFQLYHIKIMGYKSLPMLQALNISGSLDNIYANFLLNYGIIGLIIFLIILLRSCYKSIILNNINICLILITLSFLYLSSNCNELYSIFIYIFALYHYLGYKMNYKKIGE